MGMTYNSLLAQLQSYLNNTSADVQAQIPNFIYQAEQRLARETKALLVEDYVSGTFVPGSAVILKPSTWRRTLSWRWGNGTGNNLSNQLFLRSYEFCNLYNPNRTTTGNPLYYADYGFTGWLVSPTPSAASPYEIAFLALPDPITPTNQTNFITDFAPDIFLYAALLESVSYLKNDERIPTWQQYYDRALASLNGQDDLRKTDRASMRDSD